MKSPIHNWRARFDFLLFIDITKALVNIRWIVNKEQMKPVKRSRKNYLRQRSN